MSRFCIVNNGSAGSPRVPPQTRPLVRGLAISIKRCKKNTKKPHKWMERRLEIIQALAKIENPAK